MAKLLPTTFRRFAHTSHGKGHEVNTFRRVIPKAGASEVMDQGYIDFSKLHRSRQANSYLVIRAKSKLGLHRDYFWFSDPTIGSICSQFSFLTRFYRVL